MKNCDYCGEVKETCECFFKVIREDLLCYQVLNLCEKCEIKLDALTLKRFFETRLSGSKEGK